MFSDLPPYIVYIIALFASAMVSAYAVKKIIFITHKRKIFDIPDNIRKIHGHEIPSLGGIGVFVGFAATAAFFHLWNYMLASCIVLFFTGIYDDIANMRPSKKLLAQLIASFITVYFSHIHINDLYGLAGVHQLSEWQAIVLTTFAATFFINVFNFIDGIDGLACLTAILYGSVLAILFMYGGQLSELACISLCLVGAMIGLLFYNYAPAKIYMGDTGSMLSGFVIFILSVLYINAANDNYPVGTFLIGGASGVMLITAMLFPPVFDALRVFVLRAAKGISPLDADRRHLHYYLLDAGLTHAQAAWVLVGLNALTILIAWLLRALPAYFLLVCIALPSIILAALAYRLRKDKTTL